MKEKLCDQRCFYDSMNIQQSPASLRIVMLLRQVAGLQGFQQQLPRIRLLILAFSKPKSHVSRTAVIREAWPSEDLLTVNFYTEFSSSLRNPSNETITMDNFRENNFSGLGLHNSEDDQQHLILRHNQSGDLYCSNIPDRLSAPNYFDNTDIDLQLEMPTETLPQPRFLRWLLTFLHAITCLVSGFCLVFSLFGTLFSDHCLPSIVNKDGSVMKSHFGFTDLCEGVLFGLGFVFVASLVMCGLVQCSLNRTSLLVLSQLLTTCLVACTAVGGSMFTVHYAIWCDSISQNLATRHIRCGDAAAKFDSLYRTTNMKTFQTQMEIQQISTWTLFPLTSITLLCYALSMRWGQILISPEGVSPPRGFYQYLATRAGSHRESNRHQSGECDERSPFLNNQD
ncbi:hypothetical protein RRG08_030820 [Elysia crispata]|uniref:Uncharacterized protein n=1 Tax=Elysia crispata TaxID=231223 RepID=A0AAE1DVJ0_9GAST|nr:hypothetical protein RRG08_030820 [Elysia crispata]